MKRCRCHFVVVFISDSTSEKSVCVGSDGVRSVEGVGSEGVKECLGRVSNELKYLLLQWKEGFLYVFSL